MAMLKKIGRLFTIKTRLEAWLVIYAIALGAVERGRHYLDMVRISSFIRPPSSSTVTAMWSAER